MASNRHLGRIIALQTLYEQDFRRASEDASFDLEAVLARNIARYEATVDDTAFIERLVRGVSQREAELDATLGPIAPEWPIEQIARMDRVVLRIGLYELEYEKDVPPKVVINEAVELAKAFGSENSSKFVNGVLGTVLRQRDGEDAHAPTAKDGSAGASSEAPDQAETSKTTVHAKTTTETPAGTSLTATAQTDDATLTDQDIPEIDAALAHSTAQADDVATSSDESAAAATPTDTSDESDSDTAKASTTSVKSSAKTTKTTKATPPSNDAANEKG